ncbi:MAG: hypothetical protein ACLFP2_00210 [Candidatus Woesearchaeota archaeon]
MKETLKQYMNERTKVKIFLKPDARIRYTGMIISISEESITIKDKFDQEILISISGILTINPIRGEF